MNWHGMLLLLYVEENKASTKLIMLQRELNYNVMVSKFSLSAGSTQLKVAATKREQAQ